MISQSNISLGNTNTLLNVCCDARSPLPSLAMKHNLDTQQITAHTHFLQLCFNWLSEKYFIKRYDQVLPVAAAVTWTIRPFIEAIKIFFCFHTSLLHLILLSKACGISPQTPNWILSSLLAVRQQYIANSPWGIKHWWSSTWNVISLIMRSPDKPNWQQEQTNRWTNRQSGLTDGGINTQIRKRIINPGIPSERLTCRQQQIVLI